MPSFIPVLTITEKPFDDRLMAVIKQLSIPSDSKRKFAIVKPVTGCAVLPVNTMVIALDAPEEVGVNPMIVVGVLMGMIEL